MQATPNTLGGATFGNPGGTHVTIGTDGSIRGYYADGLIAYSLVPGSFAAITSYSDNASPTASQLQSGNLTLYSNFNTPTLFKTLFTTGNFGLEIDQTDAIGNVGLMVLVSGVAGTPGRMAWSAGLGWQTPSYGANPFTGGGFANELPLQFRFDAEDNLYIVGAFKYTGAALGAGSSTTVFSLPALYRPALGLRVPCYQSTGSGAYASIVVQTGGNVVLINPTAAATNNMFEFSALIPMGNIAI